jgi:ribonuclease Z
MKLVLLGTGGYFPTHQRHTACVMLPEIGVVFDAGSGMCRVGEHLQTDSLNIFLSHAHLDHILGLTCLLNVVPDNVMRQSVVHGEAHKLLAVREHLFAELIFPVAPRFQFMPIADRCPLPGGASLTHFPLKHPGGSIGFRIDWPDRSIAYVTDTTANLDSAYVKKIHGVDLLLHEAYFAENADNMPAITGHSWLEPVAEVAAAARVSRLVLVHIDPMAKGDGAFDLRSARGIFNNIEIGFDGMEFEF